MIIVLIIRFVIQYFYICKTKIIIHQNMPLALKMFLLQNGKKKISFKESKLFYFLSKYLQISIKKR